MKQMTITDEQRAKFVSALKHNGFNEFDQDIYVKPHGNRKIGVNLTTGIDIYFVEGTKRIDDDDDNQTLELVAKILTDALNDDIDADTQPLELESHNTTNFPVTQHNLVQEQKQISDLSVDIIKRYINPLATDEEAYVFLELCKARQLNPFLKDAYLIKYSHTEPATMVVGKEAIVKRAEQRPQYDGYEAGIIIETGDEYKVIEERIGTFYTPGEKEHIVGGWAKVYRKDHTHPSISKVSISEYIGISKKTGQPNRMWSTKPGTMIRKVALVQAMREAFPSDLSGMYDSSEMGVEI